MTRKRFIKLLMSCGIQRNSARRLAKITCTARYPYFFAWIVVEWRLQVAHETNRRAIRRLQ